MTISLQPNLSCVESTIRVTYPLGSNITEREIIISNNGKGLLTGTIEANRNWITVEPAQISTSSVQKILIRVNTGSLEGERLATGTLRINTNGGGKLILVLVSRIEGYQTNISQRQKKAVKLIVHSEEGTVYHLEKTRKSGGEGVIYQLVHPRNLCAKIYHPHHRTLENNKKLGFMAKRPFIVPDSDIFVSWPITRLYEDKECKKFLGFLMEKVDMTRFHESHLIFDKKDRVTKFGNRFNWRLILVSALKVASLVAIIHKNEYRIGDLNDRNILISRDAKVALIDCDSFQVTDTSEQCTYLTKVGSPEYLPPELTRKGELNPLSDRLYSDRFALSIIIFRLLMDGVHPFQSKGFRVRNANNTADKIQLGYFPYSGNVEGVIPPLFAPPYSRLPNGVQALFYRCFVAGHKDPKRRPSAEEWMNLLGNELKNLKICDKNPDHLFSNEFPLCPWCETEEMKKPVIKSADKRKIIKKVGSAPEKSILPAAPSPQAIELIEKGCMSENPFTRERSRQELEKLGISPVERILTLLNGIGRPQYRILTKNLVEYGPGGIKAVVSLLNHEDSAIQECVISILSENGMSSIPYILNGLENDNSADLSQYEKVFLSMGTGCSRYLAQGLYRASGKKRELIADILIKRGEESIQPVIELLSPDCKENQGYAEMILEKIGESAVLPLVQVLSQTDNRQEEQVRRIIKRIGPVAINPLSSLLGAKNNVVREFVREILETFKTTAISQLIHLLSSKNPVVVAEATNLVVKIGDAAIPDLLKLLDTSNQHLSASVTVVLIGLGDSAIPPLITMLLSNNKLKSARASEALAIIERRAVPYLIAARNEATPLAKREIDTVLLKIGVPAIILYYSDNSPRNYQELYDILCLFPKEGYESIKKIIFQTGGPVQRSAINYLILCHKDWYSLFCNELKNANRDSRALIFHSINEIGPQAVPLLVEIVNCSENEIQKSAIAILEQISPSEQIDEKNIITDLREEISSSKPPTDLISIHPSPDIGVLFQNCLRPGDDGVMEFLTECDRNQLEPVPFLTSKLNSGVYLEKVFSASALSWRPDSIPEMIKLLEKDDETGDFAQWVLTRIGRHAVSPLISNLESESVPIRNVSIQVLGKIGIPAIEPLIQALSDKSKVVRSGSITALAKIGRPALIQIIESVCNNSVPCLKEVESLLVRTKSLSLQILLSYIGEEPHKSKDFFLGSIERTGKYALPEILKKISSLEDYSEKTGPLLSLYLKISSGDEKEVRKLIENISNTQRDILFDLLANAQELSVPVCIFLLNYAEIETLNLKQKILEYPDLAAPSLIANLLKGDTSIVPLIFEMVSSLDNNSIIKIIEGVRNNPDKTVRIHCINILSKSRNEKCLPVLLDTLLDKDDEIRTFCENEIVAFGEFAVIPVIERMKNARVRDRERFQKVLLEIGDPAIGPLVSSAEQKNKNFRAAAKMTLEAIGLKIENLKKEKT